MKRNKHNLSHYKLLSCDMGELVPIGVFEALPGDTIQHATNALVRTAPLLAPVMHPVNVRIHHWFVPNRLLWDQWEDFITGGPNGVDASAHPYITAPASTGFAVGSLADYLGVPPSVPNLQVSALPFRAYALVYNEWYRDQDLQTEVGFSNASGLDTTTNDDLLNCSWEKDYFTRARPWEQKGPGITVPLGTEAPLMWKGKASGSKIRNTGIPGTVITGGSDLFGNNVGDLSTAATGGTVFQLDNSNAMVADLSNASAVTVTRLREALALQRYEEARARYGSRYTEYLRYLGVKSSDGRLQRPEYLGGGQSVVQFSEVLATAEGAETKVGDLKGHGIGAATSNRYRRFFEEHGIVLSFMSIRPKTIYGQGVRKMWNRRVKEDYWQKELEHIGQQPIKNKEVYAGHTLPEATFGYADRYAEYREIPSTIAGEYRTTDLNYWHQARIFGSEPALNANFVNCIPTERIFAVPSKDCIYVMARHSIQARRMVTNNTNSYIL